MSRLYLIERCSRSNQGYDFAVVVADSVEQARTIHPDGFGMPPEMWTNKDKTWWVDDPRHVTVTHIGRPSPRTKRSAISDDGGVVYAGRVVLTT